MNSSGEEAADAYLDAFILQIADKLPEELKDQLEKAIKQAQSGVKFAASDFNITGERKENILKDAGIENDQQFQQYDQNFKNIGGAGINDGDYSDNHYTILEENNALSEQVDLLSKRKKALEENGEILDDEGKVIKKVTKESDEYYKEIRKINGVLTPTEEKLKNSNKEIEDMALRCMETNTGLDELEKN